VNRAAASARAAEASARGAAAPYQRARPAPARLPRRGPRPRRAPAAPGRLRRLRRLRNAPAVRAVRARGTGLLDALLRGPGWIVLIGVLLAGIVFFNVDVLRQGRDIADTTARATALEHQNAKAVLEVARLSSSEHVQRAATARGFVLPPAGQVHYLRARPGPDAKRAAKRLAGLPPAPGRWPSPQTTGAAPRAGSGAPADSATASAGAATGAPGGAAAGGPAAGGPTGAESPAAGGFAAAGTGPAADGAQAAGTGSPGAGG
jgi:hypothetical protein